MPTYSRLSEEEIIENRINRRNQINKEISIFSSGANAAWKEERKESEKMKYQSKRSLINQNYSNKIKNEKKKVYDKIFLPLLDEKKATMQKHKYSNQIADIQVDEAQWKKQVDEDYKTIKIYEDELKQNPKNKDAQKNLNKIKDANEAKLLIVQMETLIKEKEDLTDKKKKNGNMLSEDEEAKLQFLINEIEDTKNKNKKEYKKNKAFTDANKTYIEDKAKLNEKYTALSHEIWLLSDSSNTPETVMKELNIKLKSADKNTLEKITSDANNDANKEIDKLKKEYNNKLEEIDREANRRYSTVFNKAKSGISLFELVEELQSTHKSSTDSEEFQRMIERLRECSECMMDVDKQQKALFEGDQEINEKVRKAIAACQNYLTIKRNRFFNIYSDDAKNRIYRTEIILNGFYISYPDMMPKGLKLNDVTDNVSNYKRSLNDLIDKNKKPVSKTKQTEQKKQEKPTIKVAKK